MVLRKKAINFLIFILDDFFFLSLSHAFFFSSLYALRLFFPPPWTSLYLNPAYKRNGMMLNVPARRMGMNFIFSTAFSWLNVMCLDIYWTFG
jgi:hypothetical protein